MKNRLGFVIFTLAGSLLSVLSFQNCGSHFTPLGPVVTSASVDSQTGSGSGNPALPAPTVLPVAPVAPPVIAAANSWEPLVDLTATPGSFVKFDWKCSTGSMMPYRLLMPANYDPVKYRYPIVTVLHSQGVDVLTDNDGFNEQVASVYNIAKTRQQFPAFILAPQDLPGDDWGQSYSYTSQAGDCGRELVHKIVAQYSIDLNRIYLTGGWMGGAGTWDWLAREPKFFAAGLPQGGSVADSAFAPTLISVPIWAFYGNFVYGGGHIDHIKAMIQAIDGLGGTKVKLTENPLGDPAGMYGPWNINPLRPGVLAWLFSQRRP
jgi:predicted peptidase